ncbi:MAG: hypothetical protein QXL52_01635 [Nitrososphaerales archaeon]
MSYHELWNVLWNWKKEFSVKEFSSTFFSPNPNKVLHDMASKGLLEKVGWGKYRVNSPEEYIRKRIDVKQGYNLVKQAGLNYSFTGPDAVFFWTKGGYNADRFFGFYPIHIKVKKSELKEWENFFKLKRRKFYLQDKKINETLFGLFYILYPQERFSSVELEGFKVDPLDEAIKFCKKHIFTHEPALEILDEMYDLGLKVEYREAKTNY